MKSRGQRTVVVDESRVSGMKLMPVLVSHLGAIP
jgi:hypothetical protein